MSYQGGGKLTVHIDPGTLAKNAARVAFAGKGRCSACGNLRGRPFVAQAKLPKAVENAVVDAAFSAGLTKLAGPVAVAIVAHWPRKRHQGPAAGRPLGDVDAPVANVLDALSGVLFEDDAQVAVVVAVNAIGSPTTARIDVVARPLSPALLAAIAAELEFPALDATRLTLGEQGELL